MGKNTLKLLPFYIYHHIFRITIYMLQRVSIVLVETISLCFNLWIIDFLKKRHDLHSKLNGFSF